MEEQNSNTTIRPWGFFTNLYEGNNSLVKVIHVDPKQRLSVQSHNYRSEHWFVIKGHAGVLVDGKEIILDEGECVDIPLKAIHSLKNDTDDVVEIIEIQRGDTLSEDDIIRYEDIYGRI